MHAGTFFWDGASLNNFYEGVQKYWKSTQNYPKKLIIIFIIFLLRVSVIVGALFLSWEGVGSVLSAGGIGNDLKWAIKSKKQTQEETKL